MIATHAVRCITGKKPELKELESFIMDHKPIYSLAPGLRGTISLSLNKTLDKTVWTKAVSASAELQETGGELSPSAGFVLFLFICRSSLHISNSLRYNL